MKTNKLTLLALILLSTVYAFAGNNDIKVKVKWGADFELPKKHQEEDFVGNLKDGFALISMQYRKSMCIQKFDTSLKMTSEVIKPLDQLPKKYISAGIHEVGRKTYWFYSTEAETDIKEHLFAQEIDVKKGDFAGAAREVTASSDEIGGYYKWRFVRSADSTKLLIHYQLSGVSKKKGESNPVIQGMTVLDENLKVIWSKETPLDYSYADMSLIDYQVDRNGNVFVLTTINDRINRPTKNQPPIQDYQMLKFSRTTDKPAKAKIDFGDKFVKDIVITEDLNGRMICTGYYSKKWQGSAEGAFMYSFDEATMTAKAIQKGFYEFPVALMKEYESEKAIKKIDKDQSKGKEPAVAELKFKSLRVAEDGSITLFGEQSYYITTTYYNGKYSYTRTTYYEEDVYVLKVAADGQLKWVKKIPKRQVGGTTAGLGYFLRSDGNDNYMFFVDNIKNMDLAKDETPVTHTAGMGGVLVCVKITEDGTVSKSNIYDFREEGVYMQPRNFSSIASNLIIGRGTFHKESVPLMITVD